MIKNKEHFFSKTSNKKIIEKLYMGGEKKVKIVLFKDLEINIMFIRINKKTKALKIIFI